MVGDVNDGTGSSHRKGGQMEEMVEELELSRIGKEAPTFRYVRVAADEAQGKSAVLGSSCIDHILAGPMAQSCVQARETGEPLGGGVVGHRVLRGAILTVKEVVRDGSGKGVEKPPKLRNMPKQPSAQEWVEWQASHKGEPRPLIGWEEFDAKVGSAVAQAGEVVREREGVGVKPSTIVRAEWQAMQQVARDAIEAGKLVVSSKGRRRSDLEKARKKPGQVMRVLGGSRLVGA